MCVCMIQQDALLLCLWLLQADCGLQMFMERLKVCSNGFATGTDLAGRFIARTAQIDIAFSALRTVSAQRLALHPAFKCAHKTSMCHVTPAGVWLRALHSSALINTLCRHLSLLRSRLKYSALPIS